MRGQQLGLPCTVVNTVGDFVDDQSSRAAAASSSAGSWPGWASSTCPASPSGAPSGCLPSTADPAPRLGESFGGRDRERVEGPAPPGSGARAVERHPGDLVRHGDRRGAQRHRPGRAGRRCGQDRVADPAGQPAAAVGTRGPCRARAIRRRHLPDVRELQPHHPQRRAGHEGPLKRGVVPAAGRRRGRDRGELRARRDAAVGPGLRADRRGQSAHRHAVADRVRAQRPAIPLPGLRRDGLLVRWPHRRLAVSRAGSTSTTSRRRTACSGCWPRLRRGNVPAAARTWTWQRWRPRPR